MSLVNFAEKPSTARKPIQVIAVTSGKGGVGKTNVSINLAAALANRKHEVLLLDADLGLGNVDVMLGLKPQYNLSHVINQEKSLDEVMLTGPSDIKIVPAGSGIQNMATLDNKQNAGLITAFNELHTPIDILIIDTAAGISDGVTTFCQAAAYVLIVICDEPASLTDAYAMIKVLSSTAKIKNFKILSNMVQSSAQGVELFNKLEAVTDRFLDVNLEYVGMIPYDDYLRKAVQKQWLVVNAYTRSRSANAFVKLASHIENWEIQEPKGNMEFFLDRIVK